jgi:hypothetical protein
VQVLVLAGTARAVSRDKPVARGEVEVRPDLRKLIHLPLLGASTSARGQKESKKEKRREETERP